MALSAQAEGCLEALCRGHCSPQWWRTPLGPAMAGWLRPRPPEAAWSPTAVAHSSPPVQRFFWESCGPREVVVGYPPFSRKGPLETVVGSCMIQGQTPVGTGAEKAEPETDSPAPTGVRARGEAGEPAASQTSSEGVAVGVLGSGFGNRSLWNDWAGDRLPFPACGVRGLWIPLLGVSEPDWPIAG